MNHSLYDRNPWLLKYSIETNHRFCVAWANVSTWLTAISSPIKAIDDLRFLRWSPSGNRGSSVNLESTVPCPIVNHFSRGPRREPSTFLPFFVDVEPCFMAGSLPWIPIVSNAGRNRCRDPGKICVFLFSVADLLDEGNRGFMWAV